MDRTIFILDTPFPINTADLMRMLKKQVIAAEIGDIQTYHNSMHPGDVAFVGTEEQCERIKLETERHCSILCRKFYGLYLRYIIKNKLYCRSTNKLLK